MKNIKFILLLIVANIVVLVSCKDDSLDPLPQNRKGISPKWEVKPPSTLPLFGDNAILIARVFDPNNNIDEMLYTIVQEKADGTIVEKIDAIGGALPYDLNFTIDQIAEALGVDNSTFSYGDKFTFKGRAVSNEGVSYSNEAPSVERDPSTGEVISVNSGLTNSALLKPGHNHAYEFNFFISCPFNIDDAIGTYEITEDNWELGPNTLGRQFEIVKGSNDYEVIAIKPIIDRYFLTITVDPLTGEVSLKEKNKEQIWDLQAFGYSSYYTGGYIRITGPSFFFSCTGVLSLTYQASRDYKSYEGSRWKLSAKKI